MAAVHQFSLRPVDMRDGGSPPRHASHYPPPSAASSTSTYAGAQQQQPLPSAGAHNGGPVHVPDVNLPQGQPGTPINQAPRPYPPPPTGHDLMRLFPPPPPSQFSELKGGPTSFYFQRQERAFFAQAGREQIRIRMEAEFAPRPSPPIASSATMQPHHRPEMQQRASWAIPPPSSHMQQQEDDEDESWKRPTPYNERRRAGKHTKRSVKP